MSHYRCPDCGSLHSVDVSKIYNGRLMFMCSKCNICGVVPSGGNQDEAYLGFLDLYDNGGAVKAQDLELLLEQERLLRPASEIDSLITHNHAQEDKLLKAILYSKKDYVVDFRVMNEREIEKGNEPEVLPIEDSLIKALHARNIKKLYQFQEESIKKVLLGQDVVIVAPTGSGKTEAFSIPILQKISEAISYFSPMRPELNGKGKVFAVFVYPTKALARDQLPKIRHLAEALGITVNVFDGDTTKAEKDSIVVNNLPPEIIITNFDVIHYHMLNRTKFSRLIRSAKFLVVDEVHVYSGIFGANIHHIIKRLERLLTSTNNNNIKLQIIAASATLPNAQDFCQSLFGREMKVIVGKGRKGKINFVVLFPSFRSQRSLMLDLLRQATTTNHKTIAFNKSHLGSELLAFYSTKQGIKTRVHRAGLLATERKSVEDSFKNGKLLAISATPTLELGIDIGDVDAIISDVVPIDRLTQRLGRAARSGQEGYAFLVLGNDPISQYYKLNPDDYLEDQQIAYTDPTNLFVEEYQALAMCCDKPLSITESSSRSKTIDRLVSKELVSLTKGKFIPNFKNAMDVLRDFSIRGIANKVEITYNGKVIGERQMPQAIEELHNDAIYFLAGRRYQVKKLHFLGKDQKKRVQLPIAYAELKSIPNDYPYYTKASVSEWPTILGTYEEKKSHGLQVMYCSLKIQKKVSGYSNIEIGKEALQGTKVLLDTAIEFEFVTKGLVFKSPQPKDILKAVIDDQYVEMSGYHASEHAIIEGSSMITGGASQDLGGISLASSGLIFIYDGSIGGNGASRALYDKFDKAVIRALRIVSECSCESESGCPRCTYSYRCGNNNEYLHKQAAIEILHRIVDGEKTQFGEIINAQPALV